MFLFHFRANSILVLFSRIFQKFDIRQILQVEIEIFEAESFFKIKISQLQGSWWCLNLGPRSELGPFTKNGPKLVRIILLGPIFNIFMFTSWWRASCWYISLLFSNGFLKFWNLYSCPEYLQIQKHLADILN